MLEEFDGKAEPYRPVRRQSRKLTHMNLLGIDVGTGGTRAVLINREGCIVASATVEHAPFASPQTGWAEQDARDWWRAASGAVRAVLSTEGVRPE